MKKTAFLLFMLAFLVSRSQNTKGDVLFGSGTVHEVYLNFTQTGYWDSLTANYTTDTYMKCNIVFNGTSLPACGVKFKGNSSYNNPSVKKSFKLDFNEYVSGQKYDGLKKLNLNNGFKDPTLMREKLMLDFLNRAGVASPRCTYAKVYINNTYWGLYTLVEEVNKDFLDDRFSDDRGNLFKGDPTGDLKWFGSSISTYTSKYELHTNETQNNWTDLVYFIDKINNSPSASFSDSLNKIFIVQPWLRSWAASSIFANLDSYIGSGHNYYIYHDSLTNKFNWITWDVNEAFGNFNQGMSVTQLENLSVSYTGGGPNNRPLCNKILADVNLKNCYLNEVCYLTGYHFLQSYWFPRIDSIAAVIKPHVYADNNKFFSNAQFDANIDTTIVVVGNPGGSSIPGLKSFINRRRASLVSQMLTANCMVGVSEQVQENAVLKLYPNPNRGEFYVENINDADVIEVYDVLGRKLHYIVLDQIKQKRHIQLPDVEPGVYVVKVGNQQVKFVSE